MVNGTNWCPICRVLIMNWENHEVSWLHLLNEQKRHFCGKCNVWVVDNEKHCKTATHKRNELAVNCRNPAKKRKLNDDSVEYN